MQNHTIDNIPPDSNNAASASVPISIYREVSAELQSTQGLLTSLKSQNQQLTQENQQLRRELDTIIKSALQLHQVVESAKVINPVVAPPLPRPNNSVAEELESRPVETPVSLPSVPTLPEEIKAPSVAQPLFTEQYEMPYQSSSETKKNVDLGGTWLIVAICIIVVAAFGAGYFVVRPLLIKR